jgi:hypothetical protein
MKWLSCIMGIIVVTGLVGCGERSNDSSKEGVAAKTKACLFQSMDELTLQKLTQAINDHNFAMRRSEWRSQQRERGVDTTAVEAALWIMQIRQVAGEEQTERLLNQDWLIDLFEYTQAAGVQARELGEQEIRSCQFKKQFRK